jgi:protein-disulfide isomerase
LGIKINKINAAIGPIFHQITGVPTFVIDGKVYTGYKTFEELKDLLGCPK